MHKPTTLIKSLLEIERKLSISKAIYSARVLIKCPALNLSAYMREILITASKICAGGKRLFEIMI